MKKLKLKLEDIQVKSFNVDSNLISQQGTVYAQNSIGRLNCDPTTEQTGGGGTGSGDYCYSDFGFDCTTTTLGAAITWAATCVNQTCLGATGGCGCGVSKGVEYSNCTNCTHNKLC